MTGQHDHGQRPSPLAVRDHLVYHFFFVPVTIGLAFLVAILQTAWYRTDNPDYKRMTRFFGTLLLINVAIGVVTGLVQEFEFGMNWSTYSRYVGGVFGAPLAWRESSRSSSSRRSSGCGCLAGTGCRSECTSLHLGRLVRLDALGDVHPGRQFVDAAPVGYKIHKSGHAVLTNWALLVNPTFVWGYAHVLLASLITGCLVMLAVSAWYLRSRAQRR